MCIAIPPPMGARQRRHNRLWRWVAARPARLLGLAALVESLSLALILEAPPGPLPPAAPLLVVTGLILPTLTAGLLLEWYPRWLRGEPPRYVRYGSLFHLLTWGTLAVVAGAYLSAGLTWGGAALLAFGWWLGVRTLWHIYSWAPSRDRAEERLINGTIGLGSAGQAMAAASLLAGWPALLQPALGLLLASQFLVAGLLFVRVARDRHGLLPRHP